MRHTQIKLAQNFSSKFLILLVVAIGAAHTFADQERLPNLLENEHQLSMAFETPHTKWAKPYSQGTTSILFFAPWYQGSTEGREVIELMQRFDLDAKVAYFLKEGANCLLGDNNPRPYVTTDAGTQRVLRLLNNKLDVIFLNQVENAALPQLVREKIQQLVEEGAGLVLVGENQAAVYPDAQSIPSAKTKSISGNCFSLGKGRIVLLPKRSTLTYQLGWETELDYQLADQGRAILWAAHRETDTKLSITLSQNSIAREQLTNQTCEIHWQHLPNNTKLQIELRRADGHSQLVGEHLCNNRNEMQFSLPPLRAGNYYVVVVARSPQGIEDWQFQPFEVTTDTSISNIELEKDWAEPNETVHGSVTLQGDITQQHKVRINLVDIHRRILAKKEFHTTSNKPFEFSFSIQEEYPMLLWVEAVLLENSQQIAAKHTTLRVTHRHQNKYNFVVWNYPSGDLSPYGLQSFSKHGVTSVLQGGEPSLSMAASNLTFVPYTASFRKSSHTVTAMLDENGIMKGGCINNPQIMKKLVTETVARQQKSREHGTLVYSLGDENAVRGSCLSSHCLHAYQDYLQRMYGTIQKLNESWDSEYHEFSEIKLLADVELPAPNAPKWFKEYFAQRLQKNLTDNECDGEHQIALGDTNDELRALQAENFPRWYDRQAFQCENYVNWCKKFAQAFRKLDPQSLTGFEGTDSFSLRRLTTRSRQGGDLDAFVRELEYFGPYHGPANEVVRSIASPLFPMGNWFGYSMDREVLLERYWDQITNGMNTVQWWRWDNLNGYHGFLSPTFSPFPGVQELLDDTKIVREGLGSLLMHCNMHDDGIAMLYSMPSTHIAHFDGNRTYGLTTRDHGLWHKLLHDSGVQFRYVTDRMLRLGEFDASKYQVLILPLSFAIGPEEANIIRNFVENGGTLLADVRTGTYDGHCKPLASGILDEVFGIKRTGKQDAVKLDRLHLSGNIGQQAVEMRWGNWYGKEIYPRMKVDPTVTTTSGEALGHAYPIHYSAGLKHPVGIVNNYGKGKAVLLNFPIYNAPAQPLAEGILKSAGVQATIKLQTPHGERITGLEITRWKNSDVELIALFGHYEGEVQLQLPKQKHVYELKNQQYLGEVQKLITKVRPNRAKFFALLPQQPKLPKIQSKQPTVNQGELCKFEIHLPSASGKHSLNISLQNPSGEVIDWFQEKILVDQAPVQISIPFAHNDPTGEWKIVATDLYTGNSGTYSFIVK